MKIQYQGYFCLFLYMTSFVFYRMQNEAFELNRKIKIVNREKKNHQVTLFLLNIATINLTFIEHILLISHIDDLDNLGNLHAFSS